MARLLTGNPDSGNKYKENLLNASLLLCLRNDAQVFEGT